MLLKKDGGRCLLFLYRAFIDPDMVRAGVNLPCSDVSAGCDFFVTPIHFFSHHAPQYNCQYYILIEIQAPINTIDLA
jgi:hypothetical protein